MSIWKVSQNIFQRQKSYLYLKIYSTSSQYFFRSSRYGSIGIKYYACVIVDDFSKYTWVLFLANEDGAFDSFKIIY